MSLNDDRQGADPREPRNPCKRGGDMLMIATGPSPARELAPGRSLP
jgi:hypothetical protein